MIVIAASSLIVKVSSAIFFFIEQNPLWSSRKVRGLWKKRLGLQGKWNSSSTHDTHLCLLLLRPLSPDFPHSFLVSDLGECLLCLRLRRRGSVSCLALLIGHVVISDLVGQQRQNPMLLFWTEGWQEDMCTQTNTNNTCTFRVCTHEPFVCVVLEAFRRSFQMYHFSSLWVSLWS